MIIRPIVYLDGLIAGLIGGAFIAIWFLFLDTITRLPLYTPSILGEGLFLGTQNLATTDGVQVSLKLTLLYSGVHGLVFMVLGVIAAYLLLLTKKRLNFALWILLIFVILEFGFVGTTFILAKPVIQELEWSMVLLGNFFAASGIASYLWVRRSTSTMNP